MPLNQEYNDRIRKTTEARRRRLNAAQQAPKLSSEFSATQREKRAHACLFGNPEIKALLFFYWVYKQVDFRDEKSQDVEFTAASLCEISGMGQEKFVRSMLLPTLLNHGLIVATGETRLHTQAPLYKLTKNLSQIKFGEVSIILRPNDRLHPGTTPIYLAVYHKFMTFMHDVTVQEILDDMQEWV